MRKNIFLFTIDALRYDYLNEDNAPFLSSLSEKGINFENAISTGAGTPPSFKGMMSELYPNDLYDVYGHNIPLDVKYLPEELRDRGYHTVGITNNPHLTRIQGYDRGFDVFIDGLSDSSKEEKSYSKKFISWINSNYDIKVNRGKYLFGKILSLLNDRGYTKASDIVEKSKKHIMNVPTSKSIFLWSHFMDVHSPYNLNDKYYNKNFSCIIPNWKRQWLRHQRHSYGRFSESDMSTRDLDELKRMYMSGLRCVDENIKNLYRFLQKENLLDDSMIVITSDHGENLGNHDLLTHRYLYDDVVHIPLIVLGEGEKTVDNIFSHNDLMDFILDGDMVSNEYVLTERNGKLYGIEDNKRKVIFNNESKNKEFYSKKNGYEHQMIDSEICDSMYNSLMDYLGEKDRINDAIGELGVDTI